MANLIGLPAPTFKAHAAQEGKIIENFTLERFRGKYVLFFFYPLDFTFVCPTELHAFQEMLPEFEERGAEVVGCSVDSVHSHLAWLRTPKAQGGIEGITYPIVADLKKEAARAFDVLHPEEGIAFRALFLIDREGRVRHSLVNDLPIGRSVDEALRTLDALINVELHGEVCPANWTKGEKAMQPSLESVENYFAFSR